MQYENNLRFFFLNKTQDLVFKRYFSKRYIWKKGGRLIIRVLSYSGQYGTSHGHKRVLKKKSILLQLKGSYDVAKNNIILCIWCNAMCLRGSRFKKHIIFPILYIIVAPLCSAFLKRVDFYKAHRSEKRGVLWLASYPVRCDWPNTSSVWRKCYAPYRIVMPCPGVTRLKQ